MISDSLTCRIHAVDIINQILEANYAGNACSVHLISRRWQYLELLTYIAPSENMIDTVYFFFLLVRSRISSGIGKIRTTMSKKTAIEPDATARALRLTHWVGGEGFQAPPVIMLVKLQALQSVSNVLIGVHCNTTANMLAAPAAMVAIRTTTSATQNHLFGKTRSYKSQHGHL